MLTSSISLQVSSRLTILAAQIVGSQTVLYGGVILKATPSAMLVVSSSSLPDLILLFAFLLSVLFWGLGLGWTRVSQTRQGNLLISSPFSFYSTFKDGGCTSCHFSAFLALQCPKVACPSPGLFPI